MAEIPSNSFPFSPRPGSAPTPPPSDDGTPTPRVQSSSHHDDTYILGKHPERGAPRSASAWDGVSVPELIGPYRIKQQLARGGMGAVLLGEDEGLRRLVAVKIMMTPADDPEAMARFQREARATAAINHRNVATVYMVGTENGMPFIAMEYVDGGSLSDLIKGRKRLAYSRVADILTQAAEGLRAAYRQGIIHRDIKPGNLMLTSQGEVKVVDFGLAKAANEQSWRTTAGMVMGTPRYMSPEQVQGREVDFRSDIYSLGATIYHLLAGRPPFDGETPAQTMMKHLVSPLPPLRSINPDVPMEFDDLIRRCMEKDPKDRYQDYADLISDAAKVKLQYTARERGDILTSANDLPTIQQAPSRRLLEPPPWTGVYPTPSSSTSSYSLHEGPLEAGEEDQTGRKVLLAGLAIVFVLIIGMLLFTGNGQVEEAPTSGGEPSGLVKLLEKLQADVDSVEERDASAPVREDYLAYLATIEIMEELGAARFLFEAQEGRPPKDLAEVARSPHVNVIFEMTADGTPLDGWRQRVQFSSFQQTLQSPGLDGAPRTADDIAADRRGDVSIEDSSPYKQLEAEEQARKQSGRLRSRR